MTKRADSKESVEVKTALALLQKSPQSKLIRYIWGCLQDDPGYIKRNLESIERVISDILKMHDVDARKVLAVMTVFELVLKVADKLKITMRSEWYTQF